MKKIILSVMFLTFVGVFCQTANAQINGCKKWLGRTGEFNCDTKPAYDICVQKLKNGEANYCMLNNDFNTAMRRISTAEAVDDLSKKGCSRNGSTFECSNIVAYNACLSYKNYGAITSCKNTPPKAVNGNLYVYATGTDNVLWAVKSTNGKWGAWEKVGGILGGGPEACSPNPGKILVTLIGKTPGPGLWQVAFDYTAKKGRWMSLGAYVGSDPTVACDAGDKTTMFVRMNTKTWFASTTATNGNWKNTYDTSQIPIGTPIEQVNSFQKPPVKESSIWDALGDLVTFKWGGDTFTAAKTGSGSNSDPITNYIIGADDAGGCPPCFKNSNPDAVYVNGSAIAFARANDGTIYAHKRGVKGWTQVSTQIVTSDPTAVYLPKRKAIWLFARGTDNKLWASQITDFTTMKASFWLPWGDTLLAGSPDASTWEGNRVDIVARAADGTVLHFWRDDTEALVKKAQIETIPNGVILHDPTIVGAKW
jgi:hypothetical protein